MTSKSSIWRRPSYKSPNQQSKNMTSYTQVDANEITDLKQWDEDMMSFKYKGVEYVYYLSFIDAYWGMVEENEITLNPYLHDDLETTGTVGRWDPEKKTAVFEDEWLKKQREEEE